METKIAIFRAIVPLFFVGFLLFSKFVESRLPERGVPGWRLFRVGGCIVLFGLALAAFFLFIELGAACMLLGSVVGGIGLFRLLLSRSKSAKE